MKRILTTLSEKWPEYLLEILVITIGILGAFALNNWNENRKEEIVEEKLYRQLLLDYQANLDQLNQKIALHVTIVNAGQSLLQAYDHPESAHIDSIINNLSIVGVDPTFDPITNDLSGSGKINLIENPELNRLLSNWSSDIVALREVQLMWSRLNYSAFENRKNELGIGRDVKSVFWEDDTFNKQWILGQRSTSNLFLSRSKRRVDKSVILNDFHLEGIISMAILASQASVIQGDELKERIERIIFLINEELE
ncbi:MAG: hypothetical protein AB8B73_12075 [Ekhidna sp.]